MNALNLKDDLLEPLSALMEKYREQIDALRKDNEYLRKENAALWISVHEGQDAVTELRAMLERAVT